MKQLCAKADELDVVIELSVKPKDQMALIPYYRRFGFRKMPSDDDYYAMRRLSPSWKLRTRKTP